MSKFVVLYAVKDNVEDYKSMNAPLQRLEVCGFCSFSNFEKEQKSFNKLPINAAQMIYASPGFIRDVQQGAVIMDIYEPKSIMCSVHALGRGDVRFAAVYEVFNND